MKASLLHQLLLSNELERTIAINGQQQLTIADLQRDVAALMASLSARLELLSTSDANDSMTNSNDATHAAENIGIICQQPWTFLVALLAVQQLGKQPLVFSNIQDRQAAEYCQQWLCITDKDSLAGNANTLAIKQVLNTEVQQAAATDLKATHSELLKAVNSEQAKLTLYTSGSTGEPAAIAKNLAQLELEAQTLERDFGTELTKGSVFVGTVAHYHIYGMLFRLCWPLLSQRMFDCALIQTEEQLLPKLTKPLAFISSPAFLSRLQAMPGVQAKSGGQEQQISFSSGGPLDFASAQQAKVQLGALPIEVYGSTETGGIGWRRQDKPSTPWQKFSLVKLALNDGCLHVSSDYIGEGQFQTQDLVELIDQQHFRLKGRADRIVKIAEKRISLDELEKTLSSCQGIEHCAIIALKNAEQTRIGAVVTLNTDWQQQVVDNGQAWLWKNIRAQLKGLVEPVALPRQVRVVEAIAVNQQGKRNYVELEKLFQ
ncbi:acyl-CoA synthetase [Shewanella maritima]|uniref:Acyl-CoA synthetase n=1 Tax=Shewanella maritima TaxID=2520507 RepID=A0A411PEH1_9GAMM|nr:AMP-binding protein [Shewanella maritima]QBF81977.1 acyl-CoA synthetase [Shewanella maritima]